MNTVVVRFHHVGRDLDRIEQELIAAGAKEARITGYTVAITFDADSHAGAAKAARKALDRIGATRIKITKRKAKLGSEETALLPHTARTPADITA